MGHETMARKGTAGISKIFLLKFLALLSAFRLVDSPETCAIEIVRIPRPVSVLRLDYCKLH